MQIRLGSSLPSHQYNGTQALIQMSCNSGGTSPKRICHSLPSSSNRLLTFDSQSKLQNAFACDIMKLSKAKPPASQRNDSAARVTIQTKLALLSIRNGRHQVALVLGARLSPFTEAPI